MRSRWLMWGLAVALVLSPRFAGAQCGPGMMGGGHSGQGHDHGEKAAKPGEKKMRQQIGKLLAEEQSRALLMEAILADPTFVRLLVGRIAEVPEWRALAAETLGLPATGTQPSRVDSAAAAAPPRGRAPERAVYRCPMHPEVTSDRPGRCPKCGMALERAT